MRGNKRYNFKKILENTLWVLIGMGTIVLLGAAMYKKNYSYCKAVEIKIEGVKDNFFIDKADVNIMMEEMNFAKPGLRPLNSFDLAGMETYLKKNEWIKSAELYFDNNNVLRINITEREPIARIFTTSGSSFYIDSTLKQLALSSKFSARLPVFTNFPVTGNHLSKADSTLLTDIKNIGHYISQDPFWMAQIEQIDITMSRSFEMIPKIGNQIIIFGPADSYKEKFNNLLVFYKNVQSKVGWNKYAEINVSYKDQVVAVKRGAAEIKLDSLRTIELIKILSANAQKQANDSTSSIQLVQPKEDNNDLFYKPHDDTFMDTGNLPGNSLPLNQDLKNDKNPTPGMELKNTNATGVKSDVHPQLPDQKSTSNEKPNLLPAQKTIKPVIKQPPVDTGRQPKAVMQPKNDY